MSSSLSSSAAGAVGGAASGVGGGGVGAAPVLLASGRGAPRSSALAPVVDDYGDADSDDGVGYSDADDDVDRRGSAYPGAASNAPAAAAAAASAAAAAAAASASALRGRSGAGGVPAGDVEVDIGLDDDDHPDESTTLPAASHVRTRMIGGGLADPELGVSALARVHAALSDNNASASGRRRLLIGIGVVALAVAVIVAVSVVLGVTLGGGQQPGPSPPEPVPPTPSVPPFGCTTCRDVRGSLGAVAADEPRCSQIGVDLMRAGGNALDGAIGAGLCLGVLNQFASGIGGGGYMTISLPNGTAVVVDMREVAPASAWRLMYAAQTNLSVDGGLASGVPGEVRGYYRAWQRYGRLSWAQIVAPSAQLARNASVGPELARRLVQNRALILNHPTLRARFAPLGELLLEGEPLLQPALADTLDSIASEGGDAFYVGALAARLVEDINAAGGNMTLADLASYEPVMREPLRAFYHGYEVLSAPPSTGGGATLVNLLNIVERYVQGTGLTLDVDLAHRIVEAMKFSFAARGHLGDPAFVDVAALVEWMTSKETASAERALVNATSTHPPEFYARFANFTWAEDHGTTHWSAVDAERMAVSVTSTVNLSFGARYISPQTGVVMNNQMNDFTVAPDVPNAFNLPPSVENEIGTEEEEGGEEGALLRARAADDPSTAPGKRPLSSTSPTIVRRDGVPFLVVGAAGGPTIITSTLQVILDVLHFGKTPFEAVSTPRFHHQLYPNRVEAETGFPSSIAAGLRALGHDVVYPVTTRGDGILIGVANAVMVNPSGELIAAADPRRQSLAAAY